MRNTLLRRGGVLLDEDVGSYSSFLLAGTADGVHKSEVKVITVGLCICSLRFGTGYPDHDYQLPRRRKSFKKSGRTAVVLWTVLSPKRI